MTDTQPIITATDGVIATVTINRPERRNALNMETWRLLGEAFRTLSANEDLRCVVLRGAGTVAFAAGADIAGFAEERSGIDKVKAYDAVIDEALAALDDCNHPIIAMIHGYCLGGGLELAATCDLRIAGESAKCGVPVSRTGIFLGYKLLQTLVPTVGRATALQLLLEGKVYDAAEAERAGIVGRVVPDDRLEAETYALAARIAEGAPLAARYHRKAVRRVQDPTPLSEAEIEASYAYAASEDYHNAYKAFVAKQKPTFKGR